MAYTALEKMRKINEKEFGRDVGPMQPALYGREDKVNDLKSAALRFIHEHCEGLRFNEDIEKKEIEKSKYFGTSIKPNQIPYNMQMDIDRLCLERALERFIDSGVAEDAYDVYYCYLEMFFGRYGKSKKMVELLSEFEANGSSLLMKHRDHYSHSVYVFALGLAIFETNRHFRKASHAFYGFDKDIDRRGFSAKASHFFLEYWGLTSLFHDIGYPFELPFEQVMSYYEVNNQERGQNRLYLTYRNVEAVMTLNDEARAHFEKLYGRTFHTTNELLAFDITRKLGDSYGFSEGYMMHQLEMKPTAPDQFNYYMDHAWFSATRLYRELQDIYGDDLNQTHVDALSAILLHNSLYKFSIAFYKDKGKGKPRLAMSLHPLAYMLMLCDELQCWDRTAYGRNSRTELQPMAVRFDFDHNRINAEYIYDADEQGKIDQYREDYEAWKANGMKDKPPRLKAYSDMAEEKQRFVTDIESIVDMTDIPLTVTCTTEEANRKHKHIYLSNSNFLHMHDFAVALSARYSYNGKEYEVSTEQLEKEFEELSLEYKLSNINQVKSFSKYLHVIYCFYTDRPVDFNMLKEFTPEMTDLFAPMEHERWVREHQAMGWRYGDDYEHVPVPRGVSKGAYQKMLREHTRCHKLTMDEPVTAEQIREHYENLPESEKEKDWQPFNSMLKLIKKFDGLRIYSLEL